MIDVSGWAQLKGGCDAPVNVNVARQRRPSTSPVNVSGRRSATPPPALCNLLAGRMGVDGERMHLAGQFLDEQFVDQAMARDARKPREFC